MGGPDIVVVGAGAAGIAAARAVLAAGRSVRVLEARQRAGGRAWTDATTLGAPFDLGATWLHQAGDNALTALSEGGFDHDTVRSHRCFVDGRPATRAEMAEYDAAYARFHPALQAARAGAPPEASAADYAPRGGPWDATVAHWEGPVIFAAPLADNDLRDFLDTQLAGPNLLLPGGVGGLLAGLAAGLPVSYGAVVERIDWSGRGVVLEGGFGRIAARATIVTVPTAVLAAGAIRFVPELPPETAQAIHDLPLGLLNKVGLRAAGADRLDLPPFGGLERRVETEDEAAMTFIAWPFGRDHLMGFIGGEAAWALSRQGKIGKAALLDHAFAELARAYGPRAAAALRRDPALISDWGNDPFSLGAYSHARPGRASARRILAEPLAGGRLNFAGEACHPRLAATVGGAWASGAEAAGAALASCAQ